MRILVLGGTGFFGIHMVRNLLERGHHVTIATRGRAKDGFGDSVDRVVIERTDGQSMSRALAGKHFDVACDNLALSSNEVKYLLDAIQTDRYVMTSSASVYEENLVLDTDEKEFNPFTYGLKWCSRKDYDYSEIKRQAECALFQAYPHISSVAVRFPYVIGIDDYTKRLYFYVEHIVKGLPIFIDNMDAQIGFIHSSEAGTFLAWLAEQRHTGAINGCNEGTISMREVVAYVEQRSGKTAILLEEGEVAPYNGDASFSLATHKAKEWGYEFKRLDEWFYAVLDKFIETASIR